VLQCFVVCGLTKSLAVGTGGDGLWCEIFVLQCVAVFCSVLQCVAVCCSVYCSVLQCVAVCIAVWCSVLQCVAVCGLTKSLAVGAGGDGF